MPSVIDAEFIEPELIDAELVEPGRQPRRAAEEEIPENLRLDPVPLEPVPVGPTRPDPAPTPIRKKRVPGWRFWLPMMLQLGLILPVPLRNAYVAVAGETIVLETMAVDPYDIFRGYSQTLAYTITDPDVFEALPGYEIVERLERSPEAPLAEAEDESFYVLMEAPVSSAESDAAATLDTTVSPPVWKPVGVTRDRPETLPNNQIALHATSNGNAILYNLERYYMPEDRRDEINQTVQELQSSEIGEVKLEAKVDRFGKAIPVGLWLGDRRYQF